MAEAGVDIIYDFKTRKAWLYGFAGVGLSPISVFNKFKTSGSTVSGGLIWNFNNPSECSGFATTANFPTSIAHLLPRALFNNDRMWAAVRQLTKRSHNTRSGDLTLSAGVSSGGPVSLKVARRSNSFSIGVTFGSPAVEIPAAQFAVKAQSLAFDFGNALNGL